jgi:hypothetical protein
MAGAARSPGMQHPPISQFRERAYNSPLADPDVSQYDG